MPLSQPIFDSIDALLAPEALSALLGVHVRTVTRQPFEVAHRSANALFEIRVESDAGQMRLILKEFQPQRDWVMRLTHDALTREAMLFVHGIYARMPNQILVPMLAVARHDTTWATLLRDVSPELLAPDQVLKEADARLLLQDLAALHLHFRNDPSLENPALGLSSLDDFLTILAPARIHQEIEAGRKHPVLEMAAHGWKQFQESAPTDVVRIVGAWQEHPRSLLQTLEEMPQTLLHADFKLGNLGISRSRKTIALDWQDATRGAGVLDLGYFVALNARWFPFDQNSALEIYRDAMAEQGELISTHDLELGLIGGGALRLFWLMTLTDQKGLDWWYDLFRRHAP